MVTWRELKDNPRLKNIYETRLTITRLVREWFWAQDFVEAETPVAVRYASQEPYLSPFPVTVTNPEGKEFDMYLHSSPEYALKKLLAAGFSKVFELCKCFRNNENFGGIHNPEFTMLEWYRSPGTYHDFMNDLENLFKFVAEKLKVTTVKYNGKEILVCTDWERLSMKEVWQKYLNVNLDEYLTLEVITILARANGHEISGDFAYEDIFYKIFLNDIEPHLGLDKPIFIYDYPTILTSLSQASKNDPRYSERAECYIGGLELCNGFGELTDAKMQSENLERDRALRHTLGKPTWPVDPDFIAALESGITPTSGIALGVDRMVLLFTGANDINEVIFDSAFDQTQ